MRHFLPVSLLLIFLSLLSSPVAGAQALQTDLPLSYLVQQPATPARNPPMIILMHGYGSNEADLFELRNSLPKDFLIISVRAPLFMTGKSFQWFRSQTIGGVSTARPDDLVKGREAILAFIPAAVRKYGVDPDRIYLAGFSQGAMMCYEVGLTSPGPLHGIAPLSGKIFPALQRRIRASSSLNHLKIFIGHGDADDRVGYVFATEAVTFLKRLGLAPELHTYKGMGHSISPQEVADLSRWLTEK